MTVSRIRHGEGSEAFLGKLRDDLRTGRYRPSPCRRKLIPKPRQPGKFRPLGIPTVTDRVVQGAVKHLLEPIFEAHFWHVSYGFRPGRGCHGALEHIRMAIRPRAKASDGRRQRAPYQWVIEGDIKGCFDHIDHHLLMAAYSRAHRRSESDEIDSAVLESRRTRRRISFFRRAPARPQGGVISPLLANIALSAIEERYERWVHHRQKTRAHRTSDGVTAALEARMTDRRRGLPVFFPIRYADDFVILVAGTREQAENEKAALAELPAPEHGSRAFGREDPDLRSDRGLRVPWSSGPAEMASPIRTDATDRDPQAQTGGFAVSGETSDQAGDHQSLLGSPSPEVKSNPTRLGQLLSLLYRSGPALCVARPLCRRSSVALAHEEAQQPSPETFDDSAPAESGPPNSQSLARGAN